MKPKLLLAAFVCSLTPAAYAQQSQLRRADITAPQFNAVILEITPVRLTEMRKALEGDPANNPEMRKYEAAARAHRDWVKCEKRVRAELKPESDKAEKHMNANEEEMKKLAKQAQERLQAAKTPQEMQQIAAEITKLQLALAQPALAVNEKGTQRMATECGAEPKKPDLPPQNGMSVHYNMLDRVAAFCGIGPAIVGPDGSVAVDPQEFRSLAGSDVSSLVKRLIYSKSEAVVLRDACAELNPWLKKNNWNW